VHFRVRCPNFVLPAALYLLGAAVFFRSQIFSNFDLVFGNRGDARFVVFIHEHIYRWLTGHDGLLTPPFFFNETETLGYSEVFLLDQIVYAPLRLLGAEPLLATSLVVVILAPFAFLFLYLFLRRLGVCVPLASFAALLFTFANNLYLKSGHLQHFAVYYLPVIVYCGVIAVNELHRRLICAYLTGAFAAGVCGLLFSSGYYIAWFFGLSALIFVPIAGPIAWPEVRVWWSKHPKRALTFGVVAILSFLSALSIFAIIYAPVLKLGMSRSFGEYVSYAPRPYDILNVGMHNLIWSKPIRALHLIDDDHLANGERWIALTPGVQILMLSSVVLAFHRGFWAQDSAGRISRAIVAGSASVCILLFLLVVSVGTNSLFYILYATVPGATAIRVGYRCMIVANLFAAIAIALTSERIFSLSARQARAWLRLGAPAVLSALLALAVVEQVNLMPAAGLSRQFEREHFAAVAQPPHECQSFYVASQDRAAPYEVQLDGMMIALAQRLPTVNGWSGFFPRGWNLYDTNASGYEQQVFAWASERGIADGLCRVEVERGTWRVVTASPTPARPSSSPAP